MELPIRLYKVPEQSKIDQIIEDIEKENYHVINLNDVNIDHFIDKIKECRFFVGVDSGPLYLAGSNSWI